MLTRHIHQEISTLVANRQLELSTGSRRRGP